VQRQDSQGCTGRSRRFIDPDGDSKLIVPLAETANMQWIVDLIDDRVPEPGPRGPCKKRSRRSNRGTARNTLYFLYIFEFSIYCRDQDQKNSERGFQDNHINMRFRLSKKPRCKVSYQEVLDALPHQVADHVRAGVSSGRRHRGARSWRRSTKPVCPAAAYWVCEVVSPLILRLDRPEKAQVCIRKGVSDLWFVDPDAKRYKLSISVPVLQPPFAAIYFILLS